MSGEGNLREISARRMSEKGKARE